MTLMNSMIPVKQIILVLGGAVILVMAVNEAQSIWSFIHPWMKPPYLHIVINVIIIAIVAASRFRRNQSAPPVQSQRLISARTPPPAYYEPYSSPLAAAYADRVVELKPVMVNGWKVDADAEEVLDEDEGENGSVNRNLTSETPSPERSLPEFRLEYFRPPNLSESVLAKERERRPKTPESYRKKQMEETSATAHGGSPRSTNDASRRSTRKSKSFRERSIYNDSPPSRSAIRRKESPSRTKLSRRVEAQDVSMDRSLTFNSRSSERFSPETRADYILPSNSIQNIGRRDRERTPPTEEECETLESAWKRITEGASRAAPQEADRYDDSAASRGSSGIRRDDSPSQDELNQRFEAFIRKVNEDIRCEREVVGSVYSPQ